MTPVTSATRALWTSLGLPEESLEYLRLEGDAENAVDSSFRLGTAAQAAIACSTLAAAHFSKLNGGIMQTVSVDARHAVVECASERFYQLDGKPPPPPWDPLAGAYRTNDGYVRIHTNFPHHREGILKLLECAPSREAVAAALSTWSAEEFETVASERGMCVAALRAFEQWDSHPQAVANADVPPVELVRIGDAPPTEPTSSRHDAQPLAGVRVLELTRVLAGPTCGRALAGHGADVLWITSPSLPSLPAFDVDTSRGKRTTQLDLTSPSDLDRLKHLAQDTDVFLQSYRPGALAAKGFGSSDLATVRPGVVYAQLNAYGWRGPWRGRRGFDSLVQTATGFNVAEASAFGQPDPRPLPFQALDHIGGYMLQLGICAALCKRVTEGGSWEVRVSLAGVGHWIRSLGRLPVTSLMRPLPKPGSAEAEAYLELWKGAERDERTRGRRLRAVRRAALFGGEDGVDVRYAPLELDVHDATWV
ncbi:putative l-carnitine-related dehydratase protein [Auricularia subglabra TFB-10046 SS5]|nr:putative l-carnitine-related dehydratase protein [Auricularia subglabra TFB-10046 SS5]